MPPGVAGRKTAPKSIVEPKIYRPTMEEFKDFMGFIRNIEKDESALEAGICKIIPPDEWVPRKAGYNLEDMNYTIEGPIKQKFQNIGDPGCYQTKGIIQPKMSVLDYHKLAHSTKYKTPANEGYDDLEKKYWKSLGFVAPVYGCDVSNTISDPDLTVWNISNLGSILNMVSEDLETTIQGVNSPYLYFGMWKATFSWHVEDMDLYAINMVHHGAPKTWYCVPPKYGHYLEKACNSLFPNVASFCSNFMRHKTCLLNPNVMDKFGVPYQKLIQKEREIIVVFPYAYHSGFNHGFNIAESTNFATERWVEFGKRARPCNCDRARVKFSMDPFVKKYQPEKYELWKANKDIAPHPYDPPEVANEILLQAEDPDKYAREQEEKLKKEEEKRLRIFEQKKKQKEEEKMRREEEKLKKEAALEAAMTKIVQVFRIKGHPIHEIEIDCNTMSVISGREVLSACLKGRENDLPACINEGLLYQVAEKRIQTKRKSEDSSENIGHQFITEKKRIAIFRHVFDAEVHFSADPDTHELASNPSEQVVNYIKTAGPGTTVSDLITSGIFEKVCDCYMQVKRIEIPRPPPIKKAKIEHVSIRQKTDLEVYRHSDTGDHLTVSAKGKKLIGRANDKIKELLGDSSIESLIEEGILKLVGQRKSGQKEEHGIYTLFTDTEMRRKIEVASSTNQTIYSFESDPEMRTTLLSKDQAFFVPLENSAAEFSSPIKVIEALLKFEFCPEHQNANIDLKCQFCHSNIVPLCSNISPKLQDVQVCYEQSCLVLTFNQRCFIVKNEKIPIETFDANFSPPKKKTDRKPSEDATNFNDEDIFEEDDDDEELYTSDESSESNDESSDDPDYGGSGNIKEWKSGNRSQKKKKKMKRMVKKRRRVQLPKKSVRISAEAAPSLEQLTRKLVNEPPTAGEIVDVKEYAKQIREDRHLVITAFRIFRGFKIVSRVDNESSKYVWRGRNDKELELALLDVLRNGSDQDDSEIIWNICRSILKSLMTSIKDTRVFLPIIGLEYSSDESRRLKLAAAVLEGLGLVEKKNDELGGLIYKGPDINQTFLRSLHEKHKTEYDLKYPTLSLPRVEVKDEHRYPIEPPTFASKSDLISASLPEDLAEDEEIQRAIRNLDKVCNCGSRTSIENSRKSSVVRGGFRKKRCKKCPNCVMKPCEKCNFCTQPQLKKPCEKRVCLYPIPPKCPCFM